MSMNPSPRPRDEETDKAVQEFLKKGGKITICDPMKRTENIEVKGGFYGRKKKKKEE